MKKIIGILALFVFIFSCTYSYTSQSSLYNKNSSKEEKIRPINSSSNALNCNYSQFDDTKEFILRESDLSLQKYGYGEFLKTPNMFDVKTRLPYKGYAGKKGKILNVIKDKYFKTYYKIIFENCEIFYVTKKYNEERIRDTYFTSEFKSAQELINNKIFIIQNNSLRKIKLFTKTKDVSYSLSHLEEVTVIGIFTGRIGHGYYGSFPFFVLVEKNNKQKGLLSYKDNNFYKVNPIDTLWDKETIECIKKQKIKIGMTTEQAKLSWGKSSSINRTVGSWGVHEQWVYSSAYLYFENNILKSFQD